MNTAYDREAAVDYAKEWALSRNERFKIASEWGEGTNFVSQCLYSGAGIMNTAYEAGWYYRSDTDFAPSWTEAELLYRFLITNRRKGPYGVEVEKEAVREGDIVQFSDCEGSYYQSAVITKLYGGKIFVCAHNANAYMRPVTSYRCGSVRFLHIIGTRI